MPVVVEAVPSSDFLVWIDSFSQNLTPPFIPSLPANSNKNKSIQVSKQRACGSSLTALELPMTTNIERNPIIKRLKLKIESYINNKTNLDKYLSTNLKRLLNIQNPEGSCRK